MFELEFERGRIEELFVRVDGCFAGRVRLVSTPVAFQPVLTVEAHGHDEALDFKSIQRTISTTKQTEGGTLMPWYTASHDAPSFFALEKVARILAVPSPARR